MTIKRGVHTSGPSTIGMLDDTRGLRLIKDGTSSGAQLGSAAISKADHVVAVATSSELGAGVNNIVIGI